MTSTLKALILVTLASNLASATVLQTLLPSNPSNSIDWILDNQGEVFWLGTPDAPASDFITPAPFGSFTITNEHIISSIGGGTLRSGYQSLVLGSVAEGAFVSILTLSNIALVSSHPPQQIGEFTFPGGTTFSYRDENALTDELRLAFSEPEQLRLRVTLADGTEVFRTLEATPVPEPTGIPLLLFGAALGLTKRSRK